MDNLRGRGAEKVRAISGVLDATNVASFNQAPAPQPTGGVINTVSVGPAPASPTEQNAAPSDHATSGGTAKAPPGIRAAPNYRVNPEPPYPLSARRRRQEGVVLLAVTVSPLGHATDLKLKQSSGFPALDDAALRAVQSWKFEPARLGARAFESEIEVAVRFKLSR